MTAVYPGMFDPFTRGHLDIVTRGAALFDRLIVAAASNRASGRRLHTFREDFRARLIRETIADTLPNVTVMTMRGLLSDFCRAENAGAILRGVRGAADMERERDIAEIVKLAYPIEIVLLPAKPSLAHISATAVRALLDLGGDISHLVPETVEKLIKE